MIGMLSIRDVRNTPGKLWENLEQNQAVALSVNGVPRAVVVEVTEGDLEEAVGLIKQIRAQRALAALRVEAREKGLDNMTLDEINAEIAAARKDRAARERAKLSA